MIEKMQEYFPVLQPHRLNVPVSLRKRQKPRIPSNCGRAGERQIRTAGTHSLERSRTRCRAIRLAAEFAVSFSAKGASLSAAANTSARASGTTLPFRYSPGLQRTPSSPVGPRAVFLCTNFMNSLDLLTLVRQIGPMVSRLRQENHSVSTTVGEFPFLQTQSPEYTWAVAF